MKIIFIGSVQIGLTVLESIYDKNSKIDMIFTLPIEKGKSTSGFVDFAPMAASHNTTMIRTKNVNDMENIERIKDISPDLIVVCGWQYLICEEIIAIPRLGAIGFHSSLLPKYRGRAPVNWAIIMGERETGITMFYLTSAADDGKIIAQKAFPILFNDDCGTIYHKSAKAGAELIAKYLPRIEDGTGPKIHNESGSYPEYPKRSPVDGLIDFNRSALDVYNFVRALTKPYPGAYYFDENGNKIIVWKIGFVFDEKRLSKEDIVIKTKDMKVILLEYEVCK